ncbi:MAG: hypothetical protein K0U84_06025 [Actinomycetia bacterium]|nr:hypothetical protein [Actinomycetes bacterium]
MLVTLLVEGHVPPECIYSTDLFEPFHVAAVVLTEDVVNLGLGDSGRDFKNDAGFVGELIVAIGPIGVIRHRVDEESASVWSPYRSRPVVSCPNVFGKRLITKRTRHIFQRHPDLTNRRNATVCHG